MGIDYSFDIYLHRRDAGRFVAAVAAFCDRTLDRHTTLVLPDGSSVEFPADQCFQSGQTVDLLDEMSSDGTFLGMSLCFPQDAPLREYRDASVKFDETRAWPDGTTRVAVGYVYLSVYDGSGLLPEHLMFSFMPATSGQSRLFLSSPSIRATFVELAMSGSAALCLLDVEQAYKIVVTAGDRPVSVEVPGPVVLWNGRAPKDQAYRELLARLAGNPPGAPKWIIGPDHADYAEFVDDLARSSQVTGVLS